MTAKILPIALAILLVATGSAAAQTATETVAPTPAPAAKQDEQPSDAAKSDQAGQNTKPAEEKKTGKDGKPKDKANSKPVDIEADQMEVLQKEKRAIFSGKVNATRDAVNLKTDKLVVTYSETPETDGSKKTDVTFLDAAGNVLIVTRNQRITGEKAHMDVKANKVRVDGNVTVTQGKTTMHGPTLLVDLDNDTSEMTGGRVKGSFVPND